MVHAASVTFHVECATGKLSQSFVCGVERRVYVCAKNVLGAAKALRLGAKRTVLSGFASTKRLL